MLSHYAPRSGRYARVAVAALVVLYACVGAIPKPALRMAEPDMRARIRTVCLEPTSFPLALPEDDSRPAEMERGLRVALESAGLTVVDSEQTGAVWKTEIDRSGGLYDPHNGRRDEEKFQRVRSAVLRTLHDQLGCDASLNPEVAIVLAPWVNGTASWDGVSDSLGSGWGSSGRVGALSLWVRIVDAGGNEIYFGTGGIQVLSKLDSGFWSSEFKTVAEDDVGRDAERNRRAVNASLEPFLWAFTGKPTPTPWPTHPLPGRARQQPDTFPPD
jgi:hypothetical protein